MTIHHFTPARYYRTMGAHPPVLTIASGDTVVTTTVDAGGYDQQRNQVTARPNPMTGPFYVEGAEPGDQLAVHIDVLRPNRTYGWADHGLAENVIDPGFVRTMPYREGVSDWHVDMDAGTVTLVAPETALGAFTLPARPMIGCFGVAAAREQAISTFTSAEHGGNMDYVGFRQGVTAYFPVFVPGALFFLGDVHALQGHGEISGSGVEISADVQFTVQVLKNKPSRWPRGEDETYIFTAGNARPLDQALQHATTEMMRWLEQDYGLDYLSASYLVSQSNEYEVGNVFDPAYTMICKLRKSVLAPYKRG
jgi:acetamidase/formamidase